MDLYSQNTTIGSWFTEAHGGLGVSVEIKEHLFSQKSRFQQIDVYQTEQLGKMLVLDGIIQATEFDEFAYQEMLAHLPLFSHHNPKRVLVIGGGDGGILREVAKHDCVESIDICEIDELVINTAKEYIPSMACGYHDSRVQTHIMDGNEFIKERQQYYDVIIVDSTDPIGPGEILFGENFYRNMKSALQHNGIIASQSESLFLSRDIIIRLLNITGKLFKISAYAFIMVPTYPYGNIGACVASLGPEIRKPCRVPSAAMQKKMRYYTPNTHEAAFCLPQFGEQIVAETKTGNV